jgi:hypothetical protein
VIDWADKIITDDDNPDIFFIDLALLSTRSLQDVVHYFNGYLKFEVPVTPARPLLGLLYKRFSTSQWTLEKTVVEFFRLKSEVNFTNKEEKYIYLIDDNFESEIRNSYGPLKEVDAAVSKFLSIYKDYSLESFGQWTQLDSLVETKLSEEII